MVKYAAVREEDVLLKADVLINQLQMNNINTIKYWPS